MIRAESMDSGLRGTWGTPFLFWWYLPLLKGYYLCILAGSGGGIMKGHSVIWHFICFLGHTLSWSLSFWWFSVKIIFQVCLCYIHLLPLYSGMVYKHRKVGEGWIKGDLHWQILWSLNLEVEPQAEVEGATDTRKEMIKKLVHLAFRLCDKEIEKWTFRFLKPWFRHTVKGSDLGETIDHDLEVELNLKGELESSAKDCRELITDPRYTHGHLTLFRQPVHLYSLMKCKPITATTNTTVQSDPKVGLRDIQKELQLIQLQL